MLRVAPLYYHYSNEPSICDVFDNSHVQYISDTLHISLDQYLTTILNTLPNMQNMRFFCCSIVPILSIMNEKMFSNRCLFLKAKGKTESKHEVFGLWQRSVRLHDVIVFDVIGRLYPKDQE